MEVIDNSKEEILIKEKEKQDKNEKVQKIKNVEELKKYIPELKENKTFETFREKFYHDYSKKNDNIINLKIEEMNILELLGFGSGMGILLFPILIIYIRIPLLLIIIYILAVFLQFFSPEIKIILNSKDINSIEDFKNKINEITKTNLYFENEQKQDKEMEDMEFILKNCIDISGEMDMTKPPEFIWEEKFRDIKKISNINQKKVNNIVRISICPIQMFTVDKSTERKLEVYLKYYSFLIKKPDLVYKHVFLRKFNCCYLLSIPFLCSSLFILSLGIDNYNVEPKKIISCDQDLNTNYYLTLCSNLKPKYILHTGEEIIFKEEDCITKADEEKLKIFYEKFSRNLGKSSEVRDKLIEYGYVPKKKLYNKTLGNLTIDVYVNDYYNIEFILQYDLKNVVYSYTRGRNYFSFQCEVNLDCTKEGLEKVGDLNYLYIKYMEFPIIFGNYENLSFIVEFDGARTVFGPEIIYDDY